MISSLSFCIVIRPRPLTGITRKWWTCSKSWQTSTLSASLPTELQWNWEKFKRLLTVGSSLSLSLGITVPKLPFSYTWPFFFSVHHLNLNVAIEAFDAHGLRGQNDKLLDVPDMVTVLSSLYESIAASQSQTTVNIPLCLDLTLNWMLNIYDWWVSVITNTTPTFLVRPFAHGLDTK